MSYTDAHVHFWDRSLHSYPWLDDEPKLGRRYLLEDYRAATADDPPDGFVFVQAAADNHGVAEARWVQAMCADQSDFEGMIVWAPMHAGAAAVGRHLDHFMNTGADRILGARQLIQWMDDNWLRSPFVEAVAALGARGLCFDICIMSHQLDDAVALVQRSPDTRLVIDHFGKPDIADDGFAHWQPRFRELARDNVWCKLSGLVTEADHDAWTVDQLLPYVMEAIEVFGVDRILWGSDWPVVNNAASHCGWRQATAQLLGSLTAGERDAVMRTNAQSCYGLNGSVSASGGSGP